MLKMCIKYLNLRKKWWLWVESKWTSKSLISVDLIISVFLDPPIILLQKNIFNIKLHLNVITKHIKNIYKEKELEQKSSCFNMKQVQIESKRSVIP